MFMMQSPGQAMVDPALRGPPQAQQYAPDGLQSLASTASMQQQQVQMQQPQRHTDGIAMQHDHTGLDAMGYGHHDTSSWSQVPMGGTGQGSVDDNWSTSSTSGPIVPTTLNVGDWFEFFGIPNGDISALGQGVGGYG